MGLFSKSNLKWYNLVSKRSSLMGKSKLTGNSVTRNSKWDEKCECPLSEAFLTPQPTEKTNINKSGGLTDCC